MRIVLFIIYALLLLLFNHTHLAAAQGFMTNCTWQSADLVDHYLGMFCNDDDWVDFDYKWTWFDLNQCLINNGGSLVPFSGGSFWDTCKGCSVEGSKTGFPITCYCFAPAGKLQETSYDLNRTLYNHNGTLGCFGHQGNSSRCRNGPCEDDS